MIQNMLEYCITSRPIRLRARLVVFDEDTDVCFHPGAQSWPATLCGRAKMLALALETQEYE
jgi:hypothetical protein